MKLIIIRHAAAIERSFEIPDQQRYLTPKGRAFMRNTARTMIKKGFEPGIILTSPLVRAVQTAEIMAEALTYVVPVIVTDELSTGFDAGALRRLLKEFQQTDELAIVGHEPDLSAVVSTLLFLKEGFSFKKGTAIKLTVMTNLATPATFKWLVAGKKLITSQNEAIAF